MKTVGAFDAKTHLNELLQRASKGETIQITRRGIPVAKLSPPDSSQKEDAHTVWPPPFAGCVAGPLWGNFPYAS